MPLRLIRGRHSIAAVLAITAGFFSSTPASALTVGAIEFKPCELGRAPRVAEAQCAKFPVAEDAVHPEGRHIDLALAWIPARRTKARPDVAIYLAGGPGQAARDVYPQIAGALAPLNREHAVLLIDQRGTGDSNALDCAPVDWRRADADTPEVRQQLATACLADVQKHADPRFYTTSDYIHDIEQVQRALGSPPLDVLGGSYGTRVALELLRRDPDAVRSVVLDGVVPPELVLPDVLGANLDVAIRKIFADCVADPACHARFGDPQKTLDTLRQTLAHAPRSEVLRDANTGVETPFMLTSDLVAGAVRFLAYQPETATLLPLLLDQAAKGYPQPLAAQLASSLDSVEQELAAGMGLSVICAEDAPLMKAAAMEASKAPTTTLVGEDLRERYRSVCTLWPRGAMPADFHTPVSSAKPILLFSGEYDPVTPPAYAAQVAAHLPNSRSLVGKGQGHIQLLRGCVPKLVADFVDHLDAKGLDASCFDALAPQPIFLSPAGPAP